MKAKETTFVGDLRSAARALDESADLIKNSVSLHGRWTDLRDKPEHDELRRLAKRMRELARAFQQAPTKPYKESKK